MPPGAPTRRAEAEEVWEVLREAPVRHRPVCQHALHGNVRLLVGWGPGAGKTARLLSLAAERSRYARVVVVCAPERVAWVRAQLPLPAATVIASEGGRIRPRALEASGAEEIFVDDLERLHPDSSYRLTELARHLDLTVAVSAQHLPRPQNAWDAAHDRAPRPTGTPLSGVLLRAAYQIEGVDARPAATDYERAWQVATARMVRREQDARAPQAHVLPHTLVLLPADPVQAEGLLDEALQTGQTGDGRVFAFACPGASTRWASAALAGLCASRRVPLIVPAEAHLALRRARLALQPERLLTVRAATGETI